MRTPTANYTRKSSKEMAGAARLAALYSASRSITSNEEAMRVTMLQTIS